MHYIKKVFARELRNDSTFEEQKVWKLLRNRRYKNLKFRRQHVIEGFVVDFYCHELKLVIEIDGKVHEKQKDYDELRKLLIEEKGFIVIRISNEDINRDMNNLLQKIDEMIPPPLPLGEGAGG